MAVAWPSIGNARTRYERDGYVLYPRVLDEDLVQEARRHVEWLIARHPGTPWERLDLQLARDDPFWRRVTGDDRLLDIAEQFIGPDIALFATGYICKPPFEGQQVLWHQDGSYWPLDPMEVVTLWVAIDDSLPENGCLRVISGSHRLDLQIMQRRTDVANLLNSEIDPSLVDETKAVDCALQAGGVEVHHPNIIHGSNANTSPRRRCGLLIRYIPTSTRITKGPWSLTTFLLRGRAVPGVNEYQPRPVWVSGKHVPFRGCESWQ